MAIWDLHFNKDDVAIRNILIGFLATMSESVKWYNQLGTSVEEKLEVKIPFYFSTTGTERYLNDNFLNNIDFDPDLLTAEAFYNKIPRAIVQLKGFSIETQALVNRYVRMNYLKEEDDGTLNTYNAEAFMVPIIMNLDIEIYVDSILDQLKCSESIIKTFYKAKSYQVDIAYTRIPCLITFPDDQSFESTIEFSFSEKKEFKVVFAVEVKSHIPVFKEGTEFFAGNRMEKFSGNGTENSNNGDAKGHIYIPPIVYGSTSQYASTGSFAKGTTAYTYTGVYFDPAWPINPSGNLPPKPMNEDI